VREEARAIAGASATTSSGTVTMVIAPCPVCAIVAWEAVGRALHVNNPDTVADASARMCIQLPVRREDFPPHLEELQVQERSLFCVRADGFGDELPLAAMGYSAPGVAAITAGATRTTGGVAGTRRPNGAAWIAVLGQNRAGDWSLRLEDSPTVRSWFSGELIQDLVLVTTVSGRTPTWP
jgi:hypothetical protein